MPFAISCNDMGRCCELISSSVSSALLTAREKYCSGSRVVNDWVFLERLCLMVGIWGLQTFNYRYKGSLNQASVFSAGHFFQFPESISVFVRSCHSRGEYDISRR